jgi:Cdc6-like AAA superfamily ATPase
MSRITLSKLATQQLDTVKRRLKLAGQDDYIPLRICFGRSLQVNKEPKIVDKTEELDRIKNVKKEKVIHLTAFEQQEGVLIRALLSQKYGRKIQDDEYIKLLTKHIEHGLWIVAKETEKLSGYDYIATILPKNLSQKTVGSFVSEITPNVISINIGKEKSTEKDVIFNINRITEHLNPHFAIMGTSGSGKTTFLKHLLREIRKVSDYKTNFVIFDYKNGDIAQDEEFVVNTQAEVIDLKKSPLPLNVFAESALHEQDQKKCAEKIVNLVKSVEATIGKVQEQKLYEAILNAYKNHSPYPDFYAVRSELEKLNDKPDSLTSVFRPLTEQNYFAKTGQKIYSSWTDKTLIVDIHDIEKKDLVCFFVLNQIHHELKKLGESPAKNDIRHIRTIIVIDEAHYFLKNPRRAKILENIVREVRSSGGAVILSSQSPDDYDNTKFDFLEMMEFPIVLKSNPESGKFIEQKFSVSPQRAKEILKALGHLNVGEAYILVDKLPTVVGLNK